MKVLIDSNILISAVYSPGGIAHLAFNKAVQPPYKGLICALTLDKLRRVFNRKFPEQIPLLEKFLVESLPLIEIIPVPLTVYPDEAFIRDVNDRPILRSAIQAMAQVLLTGDKDFLDSEVKHPKILSARQFLLL